jgi:hypothetical protein
MRTAIVFFQRLFDGYCSTPLTLILWLADNIMEPE